MIYIYDLVLNWSDKRRYEFFEWEDQDEIEYVKKIPIFNINNFDDVLENNIIVEEEFLMSLYNKTEIYGNRKTTKVEYACIFCNKDLNKAIAIEFNEKGESTYKSNIYILDLEDVFDLASRINVFTLKCTILKNEFDVDHYLTRKEITKKKFLISEINSSYKEKDIDKLRYIYYEVFSREGTDSKIMYDELISSLNNNFNYQHDNLYQQMISSNVL